jgi:hypothetical protein
MLDLVDGSSLLYRLELEGIYEGLYDRAIEWSDFNDEKIQKNNASELFNEDLNRTVR